jgi:hypothetical protein
MIIDERDKGMIGSDVRRQSRLAQARKNKYKIKKIFTCNQGLSFLFSDVVLAEKKRLFFFFA